MVQLLPQHDLPQDVQAMAMNPIDVAAPPPGTRYVAEWYVSRGFEEETALRYLAYGHPVLLWGPRKQGCTWLCQHVARAWQRAAAERHFMVVDFRTLGPSALASLDTCLYEISRVLDEALPHALASEDAPRVPLADRWVQARGDAKVRLTGFLYGTVLPAVRGELLLVLDHADLVHSQPFYDDFVGLLRSWADKGATGAPWTRLRLLVSVSVPPARLSTARYQSPFVNLSEPIKVGDFNRAQVAELVRRHGLAWTEADLGRLMSIVGGQPYLICAVLDDVSHRRYSLDDLAAGKSLGRSSIDDHLSRLRAYLDAMPALGAAFTSLAHNPSASVAPETLDDLIRLGVVTQDAGGQHPIRYRLYERLLHKPIVVAGPRKWRVFYSYSPQDEALRDKLDMHLALLAREGLVESWHAQAIPPDTNGASAIGEYLEAADLILFLVSDSFLGSSHYWRTETQRAVERHMAGEAMIMPIVLSPCDWANTPFSGLPVLPSDALAVTRWSSREEAWAYIAQALRREMMSFQSRGSSSINSLAASRRALPADHLHQPAQPESHAPLLALFAQEDYAMHVREALRTLDDKFALASNPLIHSHAVSVRVPLNAEPRERAAALRELLIEEAESLLETTRANHLFRVLDAAYLKPVGKHEAAAAAVGMSYSTFRRNLATAIQRLVAALWERELASPAAPTSLGTHR
jgi:hypothetical protein